MQYLISMEYMRFYVAYYCESSKYLRIDFSANFATFSEKAQRGSSVPLNRFELPIV